MTRLIVKRQDALCTFHRIEDKGDFVAVLCARGFMQMLGRKVPPGETVIVDVEMREVNWPKIF